MASRDGMVGVVGTLSTANDMAPPRANPCSCRDIDDVAILELDILIACKVGVVHILDGLFLQGQLKDSQETIEEYLRNLSSGHEPLSADLGRLH